MPVSNCTDEDVSYGGDDPGTTNAQFFASTALSTTGAAAGFLICSVIPIHWISVTLGGLSLAVGLLSYFRFRRLAPEGRLFPRVVIPTLTIKRYLRKHTAVLQPANFPVGSEVVFCKADGVTEIARVRIGPSTAHVTMAASGATAGWTEERPIDHPIVHVGLHQCRGEKHYEVEVLSEFGGSGASES